MSMYNLVFGPTGDKVGLCEVLLWPVDLGRFRYLWIEKDDGEHIVVAVYTRNGGGNRDACAEQIAAMQAHPAYLRDADDAFDSTYATFYFRLTLAEIDRDLGIRHPVRSGFPVDWTGTADMLAAIATDPIDTSKRWRDAIAALDGTGGA